MQTVLFKVVYVDCICRIEECIWRLHVNHVYVDCICRLEECTM